MSTMIIMMSTNTRTGIIETENETGAGGAKGNGAFGA